MRKFITKTGMLLTVLLAAGIMTLAYTNMESTAISSDSTFGQVIDQEDVIAFASVNHNLYSESKCGAGKCGGEESKTETKAEVKSEKKATNAKTETAKTSKSTKECKTSECKNKKASKTSEGEKCGTGKCGTK